jgi:hypothetical protein
VNCPITIDAVEINSLIAARPERLLAVLESEPSGGLWQLVLIDEDRGREWRLGYYIDGYETREVELRDELLAEIPLSGPGEVAWSGRLVRIAASGDAVTVEVGAGWRLEHPRLCPPVQFPLDAPVYLGTTLEGRYFYLDCFGGYRAYHGSLDGLEREVELSRCSQCGAIHWFRWAVVRGGKIVISADRSPGASEVIEILRRVVI